MTNFRNLKIWQKAMELVMDFERFFEVSLGSAFELETQLLIIQKLELNKNNQINGYIKFST